MFETQALNSVIEFNIDTKIVGIEFELVTVEQTTVFVDIQDQMRNPAVQAKVPVLIPLGLGLEIDLHCQLKRSGLNGVTSSEGIAPAAISLTSLPVIPPSVSPR